MCCIVHNIDNNTNDNVYDNTALQYLTTLNHIVFCIVICIVTYCQYSYNIANCIVTNIVRDRIQYSTILIKIVTCIVKHCHQFVSTIVTNTALPLLLRYPPPKVPCGPPGPCTTVASPNHSLQFTFQAPACARGPTPAQPRLPLRRSPLPPERLRARAPRHSNKAAAPAASTRRQRRRPAAVVMSTTGLVLRRQRRAGSQRRPAAAAQANCVSI